MDFTNLNLLLNQIGPGELNRLALGELLAGLLSTSIEVQALQAQVVTLNAQVAMLQAQVTAPAAPVAPAAPAAPAAPVTP
jgi:outer membrane murein-binding lipoprotein Lpp